MIINFNRLIMLFLPVRLRTVKLFSLMRVLLSPVVTLYATYTAYVDRRRLRLSATPQAAIIERIVFAETGVSISISPNTSSDASPDFFVSYNADATAAQVTAAKSVIDRYKLPSKVYQVQGSVVPYTREWSDLSCEVLTIVTDDSRVWSDLLCAVEVATPINSIEIIFAGNQSANVRSSYPVASTIDVYILMRYPTTFELVIFTIQAGLSISPNKTFNAQSYTIDSYESTQISPSQDDQYIYQFID